MKTCSFADACGTSPIGGAELWNDLIAIAKLEGQNPDLEIISSRSERILVRAGAVVIKVHAQGTDEEELQKRLDIVSLAPWNELFLTPTRSRVIVVAGGRLATVWPAGQVLNIDTAAIPWSAAGRQLAALHNIPVSSSELPFSLPRCRSLLRWRGVLAQFEALASVYRNRDWSIISKAAATLEGRDPVHAPHWVHGDWHLGQLLALGEGEERRWLLIDIEDMGIGQAVWDLARPAAFYAAGLLCQGDWELFLTAYLDAGGSGLAEGKDPWAALEEPARSLVVQSAASGFLKAQAEGRPLYEDEQILVSSCRRIAQWKV